MTEMVAIIANLIQSYNIEMSCTCTQLKETSWENPVKMAMVYGDPAC